MSELLPYEQQLAGKLANITLPQEDRGWDAMRKLLDEDDDDTVVPPVNKGCRTGAIVLLVAAFVIAASLLVYKIDNNGVAKNPAETKGTRDSVLHVTDDKKHEQSKAQVGSKDAAVITNPIDSTNVIIAGKMQKQPTTVRRDGKRLINITNANKQAAANVRSEKNKIHSGQVAIGSKKNIPANNVSKDSLVTPVQIAQSKGDINKPQQAAKPLSSDSVLKNNTAKYTADPGAIAGKPAVPASPATAKKDSSLQRQKKPESAADEPNRIWFSAGLAVQQLIPVDGQKATPYNALGRKGSLGDYIPSAYFRVHQKKKFLQIEFKYGAPQYTKDISFEKKVISFDSITQVSVSNVNHLRKTYYHQLPVSLHFDVFNNFSVGAGFVWNKFQSAVVEQKIQHAIGSVITDTGFVPGKIINVKSDSSFAKSYFQFMFESQYTFRHFSIGARYAWGLQPYLTFTSPVTGQIQKERNASLNIFLRYELWRLRKK